MCEEIAVRQVTVEDLPKVAALFDLYRQFYKRDSSPESARAFLAERIGNNESVIFVAETPSGEARGFTQLYPSFTSLGMARTWIVNDLYVVENARGIGIGKMLMRAAYEHALATNARSLSLETHVDNAQARALYESLGYEAETEFMMYSRSVTK